MELTCEWGLEGHRRPRHRPPAVAILAVEALLHHSHMSVVGPPHRHTTSIEPQLTVALHALRLHRASSAPFSPSAAVLHLPAPSPRPRHGQPRPARRRRGPAPHQAPRQGRHLLPGLTQVPLHPHLPPLPQLPSTTLPPPSPSPHPHTPLTRPPQPPPLVAAGSSSPASASVGSSARPRVQRSWRRRSGF